MSESEPAATSSSLAPDAVIGDIVAVEGTPAAPDDSITRDSDVWYEDGNIVVIAQTTAFRFHKSVVSHHSSVFRDLFSVPQPSPPAVAGESEPGARAETFDGCAAVRVSDTSYDFRELLRAIYGGVSYLRLDQVVTFPVLAALARLSHKYQLDGLLAAVLPRLKGTFTTELAVWDAAGALLEGSAFEFDQAVEALNLFRLLGRPEMVPVALYGCCQLPPADLLCGIARSDGATREQLAPADLVLCLEAKGRLLRATVALVVRLSEAYEARIALVAGGQAECSPSAAAGESQCPGALGALVADCRRYLHESIDEDPLDTFYASGLHYAVRTQVLCGACGEALEAEYAQLRREVWRGLPGFMGMDVEGWDSGSPTPSKDIGQE
ncbi:hypothetical protein V8D89_001749 [Ganoderma adspersum]